LDKEEAIGEEPKMLEFGRSMFERHLLKIHRSSIGGAVKELENIDHEPYLV
jgi:hypothetical protein